MASSSATMVRSARPQVAPAVGRASGRAGRRIIIVGAGVGGLALSRALAQRGAPHVVLERAAEPGGVVRTLELDGRILELGPQRTRLTHRMRELVRTLGLQDQLVSAPRDLPLFIYRRGSLRPAPLSARGLLRTRLLSPLAKLRLLAEPLTAPARRDETVASYFIRRFGEAAYLDLLGPLFGGLYASDPRDMLVRHALLPTLRELGAGRSAVLALLRRGFLPAAAVPCSFHRGMRTLTDGMLASVRRHVRLGTRVVAIETGTHGYRVCTEDDELSAPVVVLTCAAGEAAALLVAAAPRAAAALAQLHYNGIALVQLLADDLPRAMGFQVSLAETLVTRGATFHHSLFGRDRLYTAFLGGAHAPALVDHDDAEIARIAAEDFRQVTGRAATPLHVSRARMPAWDRTWTALERLELPDGVHLCANYESRVGIPGRIARARQLAALLTP